MKQARLMAALGPGRMLRIAAEWGWFQNLRDYRAGIEEDADRVLDESIKLRDGQCYLPLRLRLCMHLDCPSDSGKRPFGHTTLVVKFAQEDDLLCVVHAAQGLTCGLRR
jgi:hypothetical protein